jgi:hypothetical protein
MLATVRFRALSSRLVSRNIKVKIYKPYREEHRLRVFENRVLRRIFGPKKYEVTKECRKWHNGELHNLCSSPITIRQVKSKGMRWAGHVSRVREDRILYKVLVESPKGRGHSEERGVDGRTGCKWMLGRLAGRVQSGFKQVRIETSGGLL